jgi:hypothetical protein
VAASPDRDLGEARAAIDRGDSRAALEGLDRARKGYAGAADSEGLEHVLDMTALVDPSDDRARIGRDNLAYATKQNLRQESRRRARQLGRPWTDPFPELQAPSEHTGVALTRGVKIAIGVGVLLTIAAFVGFVVVSALVDDETGHTVTLRVANDTGHSVTVRACEDASCDTSFSHQELAPGEVALARVGANRLVQVFRLEGDGPDACLPLRVHDAFQLGGGDSYAAKLSQATPCPGTTVLPLPAESGQSPL